MQSLTIPTGTPCKHCGVPMRHASVLLGEAPGTIRHESAGYCSTCYRNGLTPGIDPDRVLRRALRLMSRKTIENINQREQLPPAPAGLTYEEARLRSAVEDQITERRRRGIPAAGVIPETVLAGAAT